METTLEIVGRDDELAAISAFLEASDRLPGALLLEGEAGIGKTTIWREGLAAGRARSYRVMACIPGQADAQLSLSGLRDLLDDVFDEVAGTLPAPQRRALAVALLREEPEGKGPPPGAIAAGFLGAIRELARAGPVLLAVDDLQWLDTPSAALLEFAARRLELEPVALLLTRRVEGEEAAPLALERTFGARLQVHGLGPFTLGALHRMLQTRLGSSFPRPMLRKLHETSGGNPLYALELARALERRGGRIAPGEPLPVPGDLQGLLEERLETLTEETREALEVAAALSEATVDLVKQVVGRPAETILQPAVEANVIELHNGRVRFLHPLIATAATARVKGSRKRDLHGRLAAVVTDPELRARQLALATEGPNSEVAAVLDDAAGTARDRGARAVAADLFEHARRVTPPADEGDWARRTVEAAKAHAEAGDEARGQALCREVIDRMPAGPDRANALGWLGWWLTDLDLVKQARQEAGSDAQLRAWLDFVYVFCVNMQGSYGAGLAAARAAVASADSAGDQSLLVQALGMLGHMETVTGSGTPREHLTRAAELEAGAEGIQPYFCGSAFLGRHLLVAGDLATARELLEQQLQRALEIGDEESHERLIVHLAELEARAGNLRLAREYGQELIDYLDQAGEELLGRQVLHLGRALADALLGDVERARADLEAGLAEAEAGGWKFWQGKLRPVLGFVELSLGDHEAALRWIEPLIELEKQVGVGDPCVWMYKADQIEALIAVARLGEAETELEEFEQHGRELDRPWILSTAGRCRGLLHSVGGELPEALASLEQALVEHKRLPMPFERGRTLLALGRVQRRAKQRRAARETLEQALAMFEELGARLWAEQARAELARISGRAPATGELTPTERRVAELVAEGRSNKEVAAALFVTVKTVEANLSRIYAKLGIRSRAELALRLGGEQGPAKL